MDCPDSKYSRPLKPPIDEDLTGSLALNTHDPEPPEPTQQTNNYSNQMETTFPMDYSIDVNETKLPLVKLKPVTSVHRLRPNAIKCVCKIENKRVILKLRCPKFLKTNNYKCFRVKVSRLRLSRINPWIITPLSYEVKVTPIKRRSEHTQSKTIDTYNEIDDIFSVLV